MTTNYEFINIGKLSNLTNKQYILPDSNKVLDGKIFLNEFIKLSGSEISLNSFVPGQFFPFNHKHQKNEELFIILSGIGEFEIDGNKIPIKEGSIINVDPHAIRNICNTSTDMNLQFIVIQTVKDSMNSTKPTQDGIGVSERMEW